MLKVNVAADVESGGDTLGGFKVWASDAYEAVVKALYFGAAKSGAQFAGIHLTIDGKEYREQVYFTNKAGDTFYVDKNSGKKKELPGYQLVNELCLMTTSIPLLDESQTIEEKILKLYDPDSKAETNQSVPCATDVIGKPIIAGIMHKIANKQEKGDDGNYHDINEKREYNELNKFFHAETQGTATEYQKDLKIGDFFEAWVNENKGKEVNTFKEVKGNAGGNAGRPGANNAAAGSGQATKSLFNRDK